VGAGEEPSLPRRMKTLHRITFRAGCLAATVPATAFLTFGQPVYGNYIGYLGISLPALACFALAWGSRPLRRLHRLRPPRAACHPCDFFQP
jgi:hypothetical protein